MSPDLYWVAVALTTVIATSRLLRLWTYDEFPPIVKARGFVFDFCDRFAPNYAMLTWCPWCAGFWIAASVILTGWGADVYGPPLDEPRVWWLFVLWWIVMGSLAGSYLAAMLMVRDGDDSRDDEDDETESEKSSAA